MRPSASGWGTAALCCAGNRNALVAEEKAVTTDSNTATPKMDFTGMGVSEILDIIRNPPDFDGTTDGGTCPLVRKIRKLSGHVGDAIEMALADGRVANGDIHQFLLGVGVKIHASEVQRHRHRKRGCLQCGTPPPSDPSEEEEAEA